MNLTPIVAEELVREFSATHDRGPKLVSRFGYLERLIARGEDLFIVATGLPGHESHLGTLRIDPSGRIEVVCSARHVRLGWEPIANPRCFSRLLTSIQAGVDRWIVSMYHEFESTKDSFLIQRLTALKAFFLAFEATQTGQRANMIRSLAEILELLEIEEPEEPSTIRHRTMYMLALAACRLDEPSLVVQAGAIRTSVQAIR